MNRARNPKDVSWEKRVYDMLSRDPETGATYFIKVKGRVADADTATLTRNEVMASANAPDRFILALVRIRDGKPAYVHYRRSPCHLGRAPGAKCR